MCEMLQWIRNKMCFFTEIKYVPNKTNPVIPYLYTKFAL